MSSHSNLLDGPPPCQIEQPNIEVVAIFNFQLFPSWSLVEWCAPVVIVVVVVIVVIDVVDVVVVVVTIVACKESRQLHEPVACAAEPSVASVVCCESSKHLQILRPCL